MRRWAISPGQPSTRDQEAPHASKPEVGKDYTDKGELHDDRSLKGHWKKTVRPVPIPPELVALLRWHIARFGVTKDGRLFRS
ncbi:hypothetical protein [Nonomuraea basaltis]|uniref:hypothetical protein n=1 Tax=Nonomuraea basaltis TaxID=2495887 RepID=UPI00110C540C|nr:hypothetical protein [Nonomuraea basaltis]TMR95078.1 hypothetical protein EJK15_30700 [Nonomuraea basaltis]